MVTFLEKKLKTQFYLNDISDWTKQKKIKLNTDKSKIMIFNFTHNYQFTTRVNIDDVKLEVIENTKLLCKHITSNLKWDLNTKNQITKMPHMANNRPSRTCIKYSQNSQWGQKRSKTVLNRQNW